MTRQAYADLAERIAVAPPRLGSTRLVCVDGPAGSGKTTFAGRLTSALGPDAFLLHLDDLFAGWTLEGSAERLAAGVLGPLAEGRPGSYSRFDWDLRRFEDVATPVPVPGILVVEGCGSSRRALDAVVTLRIWVEAPQPLRLARGLARDGAELADEWVRWQQAEAAVFDAEDTRERADLRIDGAAPGDATFFTAGRPLRFAAPPA